MSMQRLVSFGPDTWAKGTRGLLGAHATDRPRLEDTRLYSDGSLGPRPSWSEQTNITIAGGSTFGRIGPAEGGVMAIGAVYVELWDLTGNRTKRGETPSLNSGDWRGPWNQLDDTNYLVGTLLIETDSGLAVFAWPDGFSGSPMIVTDVAPSIGTRFLGGDQFLCSGSMVHQGRSFFWGRAFTDAAGFGGEQRQRMYYSDPYDYGTFTSATQFFDVDGEISGCISLGSNLLIWTTDGLWFVLQGRGDPAEGTLNSLGPGRIPGRGRWAARVDNTAVFLSADLTSVVTLASDGSADDTSLAYLGSSDFPSFGTGTVTGPIDASADSLVNSLIIPHPSDSAVSNHNQVWTEETWPFDTDGTDTAYAFTVPESATEVFVLSGGSPAGAAWRLWTRPSGLGEPADFALGDEVTSKLTLPRIVEPGTHVKPHKVVVDVRTFSATNPLPSLTISAKDGDNQSISFTTGPDLITFDRLNSTDTEESWQFEATCTPQSFTHFLDIEIAFEGILVERVYVEYEAQKEPIL